MAAIAQQQQQQQQTVTTVSPYDDLSINRPPEVGDYVRYILDTARDPYDRRVWVTSWVTAKVVKINGRKLTVKLVGFPQWRARTLSRGSWRIEW